MWLLKHFLYKPILDAIDAREKRIAAELADADAKKAEAEKERTNFEDKNKAFDQQRSALLGKAADEAKAERERLIDRAKKDAETLRANLADALRGDQIQLGSEISLLAEKEVFAIARKALADLATVSLEERVGEVFTRRLRELDSKAKQLLDDALKNSSPPAVVRSAFDLPADQKVAIKNTLNETFSAAVRIKFEDSQDVICGIELTANGQKVAWSISSYLTGLSKKVSDLVSTQPAPTIKATPKRTLRKRPSLSMTPSLLRSQEPNDCFSRIFATRNRARLRRLHQGRESFTARLTPHEVGIVTKVSTGIATFSGLPSVGYEEIVTFPGSLFGIAFNLDEKEVGVILLGDY